VELGTRGWNPSPGPRFGPSPPSTSSAACGSASVPKNYELSAFPPVRFKVEFAIAEPADRTVAKPVPLMSNPVEINIPDPATQPATAPAAPRAVP